MNSKTSYPIEYTVGHSDTIWWKYLIYWRPKGWGEQVWRKTNTRYDSYLLAKLYCWRANRRFWK